MSRPQKYSDDFIQSVINRRKQGELIESIASDLGMKPQALTRIINRRVGNIYKYNGFENPILRTKKRNTQIKEFIAESDIDTVADFVRAAIKEKLGRERCK